MSGSLGVGAGPCAARAVSGISAVALAGAALLSACGLGGPAHQQPPAPGAVVVEMGFSSFEPPAITIPAGTTVEWRNTSPISHTVTFDPSRAKDPSHVALPLGVEPFDSGRVPAGEIFRHGFTVPGSYRYICIPHEADGMLGTVTVTPARISRTDLPPLARRN